MSFENEKVVEIKTCNHCNTKFEITDKDLEFYEKVSPVFGGKKYNIPSPTLCPDCRQQRRLSWQNMYKLYHTKSELSSELIISMFSSDKLYKVYSQKEWWSDKWNPLDYGIDFDFNRGFFEQFNELNFEVPHVNLNTDFSIDENSLFCNYAGQQKDCYLMFHSSINENCYFGTGVKETKDSVDLLNCFYSSELYECIDCFKCYNLKFSSNCRDCSNGIFLNDCVGCEFCFGCKNLVGKRYYIFNKQSSKEEYERLLSEFPKGFKNIKELKLHIEDLYKNSINLGFHGTNNENVIGDNILNSKNILECFDVQESENMKYCERIYNGPNLYCYDLDQFGLRSQKVYECSEIGFDASDVLFSISCRNNINNIFYCFEVISSNNCFGCIGLRNKSYCILNKQYTKEEYEILVPKIIEHMKKAGEYGEFFPSLLSPFGYNETVAMEYFPILPSIEQTSPQSSPQGEEVEGGKNNNHYIPSPLRSGLGGGLIQIQGGKFNWSTYEQPFPKVEKIIPANKLPENISDIPDDILNWAIECEITKKPFRIIKQELEFYRKHNLPIPKRHPDKRHLDRMALRNPRKLFDRKCDKCGVNMKTSYSPERTEIVYCEKCYEKEIY